MGDCHFPRKTGRIREAARPGGAGPYESADPTEVRTSRPANKREQKGDVLLQNISFAVLLTAPDGECIRIRITDRVPYKSVKLSPISGTQLAPRFDPSSRTPPLPGTCFSSPISMSPQVPPDRFGSTSFPPSLLFSSRLIRLYGGVDRLQKRKVHIFRGRLDQPAVEVIRLRRSPPSHTPQHGGFHRRLQRRRDGKGLLADFRRQRRLVEAGHRGDLLRQAPIRLPAPGRFHDGADAAPHHGD